MDFLKLDPRIRLGLDRMKRALALLGNPETSFASVLIAGTNGKGSTAASVESVLRRAGYKTGLFTSPHLIDESERVRVSGRPVPPRRWRALIREVLMKTRRARIALTEFEVQTAAAFIHFRENKIDLAVVEVGLGGRLDATNTLPVPEAAAITSIGYDHTNFLGHSLSQILREKMGVLRPGVPLVTHLAPSLEKQCRTRCAVDGVPVHFYGKDFTSAPGAVDWRRGRQTFNYRSPRAVHRRLATPLLGRHQIANVSLAVALCEELAARGWNIQEKHLREGLRNVSWPGRFQILPAKRGLGRPVIVDGAHNAPAVDAFIDTYKRSPWGKQTATLLFGCLKDKDAAGMIARLAPFVHRVFTVDLPSKRSASAARLARLWRKTTPAVPCADAREALRRARGDENAPLLATGSLYLAGDILRQWKRS